MTTVFPTSFNPLRIRRALGRDAWSAPSRNGPDGWCFVELGSGDGSIIVTCAPAPRDGEEWVHASIARVDSMPTYADLKLLHRVVFRDGWAYQVFAPPADHVNIHEHCLHLYGRLDGKPALPDFHLRNGFDMTATQPTIAIGNGTSPELLRTFITRVVGVDLALASTGLATHYPDGKILTSTIATKGHRGETLTERWARIRRIRDDIRHWLATDALVVIEGPATAAPGGSTWDRAGLWWAVVDLAMQRGPVAVVVPSTRAKWATGNGRSDKAAVAVAMSKRAPEVELANSDEADALALAWMGAQWLGWRPVKNKIEQACLDVARWPL